MDMKCVYVLNAHTKICGLYCNYGHVKAADESQSFCFKYYGGMVAGSGDPQFQLLRFKISAQSYHQQLNVMARARLGKFEIYW